MNPSKPQKQYTPESKAQAIERLTLGRPVAELAEELCLSANLLYSWKSSPCALRREIALLRQENEILKKAAVILGTKTPPNYGR